MAQFEVEAQRRSAGGKNINRRLRLSGRIPAVMYGAGEEPVPVSLDPDVITDILHSEAGQNTIFTLKVDEGEPANVMVKDYQLDPVRGDLIHTDLYRIAMDKVLRLEIDIEVVGEAAGVKTGGGILDVVTRSVEVECLPGDIPESIKVDVANLQINDYIRVKNLPVNPKVEIFTEPEVVIVTVLPPVKEEAAEVAPAEAAEPELIRKPKPEEAGEEGPKGKPAKPESK